MNIIEKMQEIVSGCPFVTAFGNVLHIEYTDSTPTNFGLTSLGDTLITDDVTGTVMHRQHSFMLYAAFSAINDYERLANSGILLDLSLWLERQTGAEFEQLFGEETLAGEITAIRTANGRLFDIPLGNGELGVRYQLQITVDYDLEEE